MDQKESVDVVEVTPKKKSKILIMLKKINYKKLIKWLIILGIIAFIGMKIYSAMQDAQKMFTPKVETAFVEKTDLEMIISGKGTVEPLDQYKVNSLVKGEILKAPFEEGEQVKKGELLYQISTKDVENSIKAAELSVQRAQKNYKDTLDGKEDLTVKSNETGYVKKLYVKEGDRIQAGTVIADLYDNTGMYLDIPFNSAEVSNSLVGKKATVIMDGSMEKVKGTVTEVGMFEETLPGNMVVKKVTIRVENPGGIGTSSTATASIGDITCNSSGTFRPMAEKSITSTGTGKIDALNMEEGKLIKDGEVIIRFSSKDVDSQIENTEIAIKEAKLSLENQTNQLDNYSITAPISGEVIMKNKKKGDTIDMSAAADGTLVIIYDLSALKYKMNVDELDITNISVGQEVTITADAIPDKIFKGVVDKISLNSITENGVTVYPVTIRIDEKGELLPGMNVDGKIVTKQVKNVLAIPSGALHRNNVVYIKDTAPVNDEEAKKKDSNAMPNPMMMGAGMGSAIPEGFKEVKVTVGVNDGKKVEILSGLKEGDEVYVAESSGGMDTGGMMSVTIAE